MTTIESINQTPQERKRLYNLEYNRKTWTCPHCEKEMKIHSKYSHLKIWCKENKESIGSIPKERKDPITCEHCQKVMERRSIYYHRKNNCRALLGEIPIREPEEQ